MIIFLNGSINAGKSTVAQLLVEQLSNSALLEIDSLREMIAWMPIEEAVPICLKSAASLITNFSARRLHVVVPYPLSERNYTYLIKALEGVNVPIFFFTLAPNIDVALTNRGTRELSESERERISHHYEKGINNPSFGKVIDNSNQSPDETARYILSEIGVR